MNTHVPGVRLSTDLDDPSAIPYFLWDAPMTVADLRSSIAGAEPAERAQLLGKILREARDTDVWLFTTPREVDDLWPEISRYLGNRRGFWEFLLGRWRDLGLAVHPDKPAHGNVKVDPADEIFANKLCALLGRSEIRDLVDVRALENTGLSLSEALAAGRLKDGGLTAGQLGWVLSQITIGDAAALPGGVDRGELRSYLTDLVDRLARLARP